MENGIGVGAGEDLKRLGGSQGVIQLGLDALREKKGSVDQARTSSQQRSCSYDMQTECWDTRGQR